VDVRDARQDVPKSPPATASQAITLQVASPRDDRVEAQRLSTAPTSPLATQPAAPSKPATPPNPKSNATPINEARRPPDTATGELVVSVDPYAVVYLDGKKVGETPLSTQAPVGQHRLRLVNSDLQVEKTLRVTISEGKPTRVVESW
jgi:serine/threonine-protein kinase